MGGEDAGVGEAGNFEDVAKGDTDEEVDDVSVPVAENIL